MTGLINVWKKGGIPEYLGIEDEVIAVRWYNETNRDEGLLFDYAFTTDVAAEHSCWWLKDSTIRRESKTFKLSLGDYLKLHLRECSAMNPFWAMGRVECLTDFKIKHPGFKL